MYDGQPKLIHERKLPRYWMYADIAMARAICGEAPEGVVMRHVKPGDGQSAAYHAGYKPPNYPVPAIYKPFLLDETAFTYHVWRGWLNKVMD